ncbi:MAG: GNAT family N-acetyltransferase [Bacteroidetes bacterium]|nr:GNAT family N-acetyltransferase [Bacteroidota bacterium]
MKLVERKNIDIKKWDNAISTAAVENVFQYSWYLDAVNPGWAGLITENYTTVLPVAFTSKLGVRQMIQAPFTREYTLIGTEFGWKDVLESLSKNFKGIHFRSEEKGLVKAGKKRQHQWIDLKTDFQKNYSTNARRILKKTGSFSLDLSTDPAILLTLFKEHVAHKIETISAADLVSLEKLMQAALKNKSGELLLVRKENEIVAAGFFLHDKKRITYLKGASTETAKKEGAMYFLMDQAMLRYASHYSTFDFGGSDVDTIAGFYHKFGAQDRTYYDYSIDDLPFWFKTLKKLKR